MKFPTNSNGKPWLKLDGQSGMFKLSTPDGQGEIIDPKGLTIALDLAHATQGWMKLSKGERDFQPLAEPDKWGVAPSPDHKPGVELEVVSHDDAFGDAPVRIASGNSRAWTTFVADVSERAGDLNGAEALPTIAIKGTRKKSIGMGSTVEVGFDVLPRDQWITREGDEQPFAHANADEPTADKGGDDDNWS